LASLEDEEEWLWQLKERECGESLKPTRDWPGEYFGVWV